MTGLASAAAWIDACTCVCVRARVRARGYVRVGVGVGVCGCGCGWVGGCERSSGGGRTGVLLCTHARTHGWMDPRAHPRAGVLTAKVEIQARILNPWRYAAIIAARPMTHTTRGKRIDRIWDRLSRERSNPVYSSARNG